MRRICYLWPVRLYHIFPHYLTKDTVFLAVDGGWRGGGVVSLNKKFLS